VTEKEESSKSLVTQLEATKAKADAGERATEALQTKEAELGKAQDDLKAHGDRVNDLTTKLKALKMERDGFAQKLETISALESENSNLKEKVKQLEAEIAELEKSNTELYEKLEKVGVKVEERRTQVKGQQESALKKAEEAQKLQKEVKDTEEKVGQTDEEFVSSVNTDVSETTVTTKQ